MAAELERQGESHREELEQLKSRSAQIEADTQAARARIQTLEGETAALRSEAEGKAQGQSEVQDRPHRPGGCRPHRRPGRPGGGAGGHPLRPV